MLKNFSIQFHILKLTKKEFQGQKMKLIINGEDKEFTSEFSLQEIITDLQIEDKVMAAAVNMEVVKKDQWNSFIPNDNDKIELLQFVGGG